MMAYWMVFLGGGLGSICRFGISRLLAAQGQDFPWATLWANLLSSFLLGTLIGLRIKGHLPVAWQYLLMAGFCGGFSTFSTFAFESLALFQDGKWEHGFGNIAISLVLGLAAVYAGIKVAA